MKKDADSLINWLYAAARRNADAHSAFLSFSHTASHQSALLISQLFPVSTGDPSPTSANSIKAPSAIFVPPQTPPLFDRTHLDDFATGSPVKCFGERFRPLEGRRIPRIPNGDFLLMTRVIRIDSPQLAPIPGASIVVEYDVPEHPWFMAPGDPYLPFAIIQEIALQPCGFLSAYLGTMLLFPDQEFFFRNLDGQAQLLRNPDLPGKTVSCRATLTSHTAGAGTIIQGYQFSLSVDGLEFFRGHSVFGYFHPEVMAKQTGLDRDRPPEPWAVKSRAGRQIDLDLRDFYSSRIPWLKLLDRAVMIEQGGRYGRGYVLAQRDVKPSDWYFQQHFYQDPVMPGSLGVEACLQAMAIFGQQHGSGSCMALPLEYPTTWKYRGQITQSTKHLTVEVHIEDIAQSPEETRLTGDANVWGDQLRLYEIHQAALCLRHP